MVKYVARDLVKQTKAAGFIEDRVRGDHHIYVHPITHKSVSIPYTKLKDTIAPGTAHSILKQLNI